MYKFPDEILNAKKIFIIGIDDNDELFFNVDHKPGCNWSVSELIGAIYFADQTVKTGQTINATTTQLDEDFEDGFPIPPELTEREQTIIDKINIETANTYNFVGFYETDDFFIGSAWGKCDHHCFCFDCTSDLLLV